MDTKEKLLREFEFLVWDFIKHGSEHQGDRVVARNYIIDDILENAPEFESLNRRDLISIVSRVFREYDRGVSPRSRISELDKELHAPIVQDNPINESIQPTKRFQQGKVRGALVSSRSKYNEGLKTLQDLSVPSYIIEAYKAGDTDFVEYFVEDINRKDLSNIQQLEADKYSSKLKEVKDTFLDLLKDIKDVPTILKSVELIYNTENVTYPNISERKASWFGPLVVVPVDHIEGVGDLGDDKVFKILSAALTPFASTKENNYFSFSIQDINTPPTDDFVFEYVLKEADNILKTNDYASQGYPRSILYIFDSNSLNESWYPEYKQLIETRFDPASVVLPHYIVEALSMKDYRAFEIYMDRMAKKYVERFEKLMNKGFKGKGRK